MSEEELVFDAQSSDTESEEVVEIVEEVKLELDPKKVQLGETPTLVKSAVLNHLEQVCKEGFLLQTIKVCVCIIIYLFIKISHYSIYICYLL